MTPRHQKARELAAEGVKVIPLNGKIPIVGHGFKSESDDLAQIDAWWESGDWNIGVRPCHMGLVAVDLDLAKPGGVSQAFLDLLPPTRTHASPSGGEHRLYWSLDTYGNAVLARNVDLRSENGYILWPPSVINGVEYRVLDDREPEMFPERLARNMAERIETEPEPCDDSGIDADVEGAREWCARLKDLGDYDRFALAAGLTRNFGLTDTTATKLTEEFGLRTWTKNGSKTTWQQTLTNARKHGSGKLGEGVAFKLPDPPTEIPAAWIAAAAAANTCESTAPNTKNRFGGRTPEEDANAPPITYWDKHNTLPKGPVVGLTIAPRSNHKTGLFIKYGLDIVEAGGRVLYIAAEGAHGLRTARLPRAREARNMSWSTLNDAWRTEGNSFNLLAPADHEALWEAYSEFAPSTILIDVLMKVASGDINTPAVAGAIMNAANQLALRFDCPVNISHHPGKDASRGAMGSNLFPSLADFMWSVEAKGDKVWLTVDKMKDGPADFSVPYGIDTTQGVPVIVDCERPEAEVKPPDELALQIRDFLDTTNPTHEFYSLSTLYRELIKLNNPPVLPPGISERAGKDWIKARLEGIGEYLTVKGDGDRAVSYTFRKPTPRRAAE